MQKDHLSRIDAQTQYLRHCQGKPKFELREGNELLSLDYAGYALGHQQQLSACSQRTTFTLPGFQQYLVLQQRSSSAHQGVVKVLVPLGTVCCDRSADSVLEGRGHAGRVRVQVSTACDAQLEVRSVRCMLPPLLRCPQDHKRTIVKSCNHNDHHANLHHAIRACSYKTRQQEQGK
eukprot:scaffold32372_cov17-Tisochrysis_lutea.AAC.1